jgi:peptide/nickel transport system permease protein
MGLWRYILRRLVLAVVVIAVVSVGTFMLMHVVPGDPCEAILGDRAADDPAIKAECRRRWSLDKPVPVQYVNYVMNLTRGDFGVSTTTRQPVADDLQQFVPATIELTLAAMAFAIALGIPLGIIAGIFHGRWPDTLARGISLIGTSVPVFWLGMLIAYLLWFKLGWLPRQGQLDVGMPNPPYVTGMISVDALIARDWPAFWSVIRHLIMPGVVLGSYAMGILARMLRSSLVAALADDYVRTARAKGLQERRVVIGHALRNALIPTITVLGLTFASLLAGAVLTETIFSWPGIGQYAVKTALKLDYPGLLGVTLFVAIAYIGFNLIVDVAYGILDPRIRVA